MFFSALKNNFITEAIWEDCVEVSDALHNQLLDEISAGKQLTSDENGFPITVDQDVPPQIPTV